MSGNGAPMLNTGDFSYRKMTRYYVTPLELTALALKAGEKHWTKAQEEGRKRLDAGVAAVWMGAEICPVLPKDFYHVLDMRPPEGWMLEAGISQDRPDYLLQAMKMLNEDDERPEVLR